jgi:quinol-cytochrome oxidoreductase complex cytochrome b subunit
MPTYASLFFVVIYIHILEDLHYVPFSQVNLWLSGVVIFVLMMHTALWDTYWVK